MAQNEETVLTLWFPFKGINETAGYADQASYTTPLISNSRISDVVEGRARGGQRSGLKKAFTEQVGVDLPVLKMVLCVNTYVPPETA